jgi:hypothetical protein
MRSATITRHLDLTSPGLEIGPSYSPIVPKSSGAPVHVVDHASREELTAKYRAWGDSELLLSAIEPVDVVWTGGSLADVVGEEGGFRWVVASHVVEHSVDHVQFLDDCSRLLAPEVLVALAVPDMRSTFDISKPWTSTGAVLNQHLFGPGHVHPAGAVFD